MNEGQVQIVVLLVFMEELIAGNIEKRCERMINTESIDKMIMDDRVADETLKLTDIFVDIFKEATSLQKDRAKIAGLLQQAKRNLIQLNRLAESVGIDPVYVDEDKIGSDIYDYIIHQFSKDEYGKKLKDGEVQ